jgi:catechol 2,3-dioxygenase-like lactoylglutathione lyase family enzyme
MVRAIGIDHVVLNVSDGERAMAWYRDELGLEPVRLEEWRRGDAPFISMRANGATVIDLFVTERTGVNADHVAFLVEPIDLDALAASGRFEVEMGPASLFGAQGQGWGVYVRDPDGNRVEIRHYGETAGG